MADSEIEREFRRMPRARASEGEAGEIARIARSRARPEPIAHTQTIVDEHPRRIPVFAREDLPAGSRRRGPMIMVELSSTAYVPPEFEARVDDFGNIHLEMRR